MFLELERQDDPGALQLCRQLVPGGGQQLQIVAQIFQALREVAAGGCLLSGRGLFCLRPPRRPSAAAPAIAGRRDRAAGPAAARPGAVALRSPAAPGPAPGRARLKPARRPGQTSQPHSSAIAVQRSLTIFMRLLPRGAAAHRSATRILPELQSGKSPLRYFILCGTMPSAPQFPRRRATPGLHPIGRRGKRRHHARRQRRILVRDAQLPGQPARQA